MAEAGGYGTSYDAQTEALKRRRQMALLLQQQGLEPQAGLNPNGQYGIGAALAPMLKVLAGQMAEQRLATDEKKLADETEAGGQAWVNKLGTLGKPEQPAIPGGEAESAEGGMTSGIVGTPAVPASPQELLQWGAEGAKYGPRYAALGLKVADQAADAFSPAVGTKRFIPVGLNSVFDTVTQKFTQGEAGAAAAKEKIAQRIQNGEIAAKRLAAGQVAQQDLQQYRALVIDGQNADRELKADIANNRQPPGSNFTPTGALDAQGRPLAMNGRNEVVVMGEGVPDAAPRTPVAARTTGSLVPRPPSAAVPAASPAQTPPMVPQAPGASVAPPAAPGQPKLVPLPPGAAPGMAEAVAKTRAEMPANNARRIEILQGEYAQNAADLETATDPKAREVAARNLRDLDAEFKRYGVAPPSAQPAQSFMQQNDAAVAAAKAGQGAPAGPSVPGVPVPAGKVNLMAGSVPKATVEKEVAVLQQGVPALKSYDALTKDLEKNPETSKPLASWGLRVVGSKLGPELEANWRNRVFTPEEQKAQIQIASRVSKIMNELYGAAQSAGEAQRARAFLPIDGEPLPRLLWKLEQMKKVVEDKVGAVSKSSRAAYDARTASEKPALGADASLEDVMSLYRKKGG